MHREDLPFVTIVTPSLNQAAFLKETIRSVLSQDYPRLEYIVVDGGSTDGSVEIIQRHSDQLAWWRSEPDLGQTDAINKGFARAQGAILAWLNSDDVYLPHAVREAVDCFREHPGVGLVYGNADFIDEGGRVIGRFNARQTSYARLRRGGVYIPQQAAFFRADLWHRVAPLDPTFYFAMDYDLWVRIAAVAPIRYHPRPWAQFRLHTAAKTIADDARCWPEMLRVHLREGGSLIAPITARYLLRRSLAPLINHRRRRLFADTGRSDRQQG